MILFSFGHISFRKIVDFALSFLRVLTVNLFWKWDNYMKKEYYLAWKQDAKGKDQKLIINGIKFAKGKKNNKNIKQKRTGIMLLDKQGINHLNNMIKIIVFRETFIIDHYKYQHHLTIILNKE